MADWDFSTYFILSVVWVQKNIALLEFLKFAVWYWNTFFKNDAVLLHTILLHYLFVCGGMYVWACYDVWGSQRTTCRHLSSPSPCVPRMELRSPGFAASAFIHWALMVVKVLSLQKVVDIFEGHLEGRVKVVGKIKPHGTIHPIFHALYIHTGSRTVMENCALSADHCRLQTSQFSVHLTHLLGILLSCNGSEMQGFFRKAVVNSSGADRLYHFSFCCCCYDQIPWRKAT